MRNAERYVLTRLGFNETLLDTIPRETFYSLYPEVEEKYSPFLFHSINYEALRKCGDALDFMLGYLSIESDAEKLRFLGSMDVFSYPHLTVRSDLIVQESLRFRLLHKKLGHEIVELKGLTYEYRMGKPRKGVTRPLLVGYDYAALARQLVSPLRTTDKLLNQVMGALFSLMAEEWLPMLSRREREEFHKNRENASKFLETLRAPYREEVGSYA